MSPLAAPVTARRLVGTLLVLMASTSVLASGAAFAASGRVGPLWWSLPLAAAAAAAFAVVVRAAVGGRELDRPALGLLAATTTTLVTAPLLHLVGAGRTVAPPPEQGVGWPYYEAVAAVSAAAVLLRRWPFARATGVLVVLGSALALVRSLPPVADPASVSTVMDAAFLVGMAVAVNSASRGVEDVSVRVRRARADAQRADAEAEELAIAEAERSRWEAAVHDDVLTALRVTAGAATPEQRTTAASAAATALRALAAGPSTLTVSTQVVAAQVRAAVLAVLPEARVSLSTAPGALPGRVAEALTDATAELVRNAERHNGPRVSARVLGSLSGGGAQLQVSDDGAGFDPASVDPRRLGLRISVVGRMRSVGGSADVTSAPGRGTRAELRWPR